jgi:hypothetical protein
LRGQRQSYIVALMFLTRTHLLRLTALGLPFCFLALSAVCVLNCSDRGEEIAGASSHESECLEEVSLTDLDDCDDCCPISATPASAMTDRRVSAPFESDSEHFLHAINAPPETLTVHVRPPISPACTGPPLERLCTLLI